MARKNPQTGRETCYFCGDDHMELLETHHIVPKRHGGSDTPENLVDLCPTCHEKLERLYDKRFYTALGTSDTEETVEFIAGKIAYELLTLQKDILNRISQTAEWTNEAWIENNSNDSSIDEHTWKLTDEYTDHDHESIATAIIDDILPDDKKIEVVDDEPVEEFEAEVIEEGSEELRSERKSLREIIRSLQKSFDNEPGAPKDYILEKAEEEGIGRERAIDRIKALKMRGDLYEPQDGYIRVI